MEKEIIYCLLVNCTVFYLSCVEMNHSLYGVRFNLSVDIPRCAITKYKPGKSIYVATKIKFKRHVKNYLGGHPSMTNLFVFENMNIFYGYTFFFYCPPLLPPSPSTKPLPLFLFLLLRASPFHKTPLSIFFPSIKTFPLISPSSCVSPLPKPSLLCHPGSMQPQSPPPKPPLDPPPTIFFLYQTHSFLPPNSYSSCVPISLTSYKILILTL